jgi:hypothetical protein
VFVSTTCARATEFGYYTATPATRWDEAAVSSAGRGRISSSGVLTRAAGNFVYVGDEAAGVL